MNIQDKDHESYVKPSEKGQSMIIIAIAMVALIGLLALVLDGGFAYAARRSAQNAADAGALAGANVLCGLESGDPEAKALQYAVGLNHADAANVVVGTSSVQVTATVNHDSFFAGIFGQDVVTVQAYAEAGCYNPCGAAVLPVAWACAPPAGETLHDDCSIQTGTEANPGPLYVIMDSEKAALDYSCQDPPNSGLPAGTLDCDIDDELPYENELIGGGGRSWLNLDGGSGNANELVSWIENTDNLPLLQIHTWLAAGAAVDTSVFRAAEDIVGYIVLVPVFNDYTVKCNPDPDDPSGVTDVCDYKWHVGLDTLVPGVSGDYYHIISFSLFKVTGVSTGTNACEGVCTAKNWLVSLDYYKPNAKTIEGFFLEGYEDGMEGKCNNYGGAITIYLDH